MAFRGERLCQRYVMLHRGPRLHLYVLAVFLLVAFACASPTDAEQDAGPEEAERLRSVSLRLDWFPFTYHAGYFVAKAKGWYEENGLDVEIVGGEGSAQVVQVVGSGGDTFGSAAAPSVLVGVAEEIPVVMVANKQGDSAACLVTLSESGIEHPRDLEGQTVGRAAFGFNGALLPALFEASDVDPSQVRVVTLDLGAVVPSLLEGDIDAWVGQAWADPVTIELTQGVETDCIEYRDFGVGTLGHGIITHRDTIQEDPDLVRAFVEASIRGWRFMFDNPEEAGEIMVSLAEAEGMQHSSAEETVVAMPFLREFVVTENNQGQPLGWMALEDWQETADVLHKFEQVESIPELDEVFTNDFVPDGPPL